jgi:uncharacterized membrane protein YGL010W
MRNALDLLTQYAAYHRDRRNIATHSVGVPMIVFAVGVLLTRPTFTVGATTLTPAWIVFALAALWYLSRHLVLGLAVSAVIGALIWLAHQLNPGSVAGWLTLGLGFFLLGWIIQFIGHYYEGRKPAFVDDISGLLVGPMFVVAEWLFALGWNRPMLEAIEARVGPTHLRDLAHPA